MPSWLELLSAIAFKTFVMVRQMFVMFVVEVWKLRLSIFIFAVTWLDRCIDEVTLLKWFLIPVLLKFPFVLTARCKTWWTLPGADETVALLLLAIPTFAMSLMQRGSLSDISRSLSFEGRVVVQVPFRPLALSNWILVGPVFVISSVHLFIMSCLSYDYADGALVGLLPFVMSELLVPQVKMVKGALFARCMDICNNFLLELGMGGLGLLPL